MMGPYEAGFFDQCVYAAPAVVWYARANGTGDGKVAISPIGSPSALDAVTKPGDVIILLPSEAAFETERIPLCRYVPPL